MLKIVIFIAAFVYCTSGQKGPICPYDCELPERCAIPEPEAGYCAQPTHICCFASHFPMKQRCADYGGACMDHCAESITVNKPTECLDIGQRCCILI